MHYLAACCNIFHCCILTSGDLVHSEVLLRVLTVSRVRVSVRLPLGGGPGAYYGPWSQNDKSYHALQCMSHYPIIYLCANMSGDLTIFLRSLRSFCWPLIDCRRVSARPAPAGLELTMDLVAKTTILTTSCNTCENMLHTAQYIACNSLQCVAISFYSTAFIGR